MAEAPDRLAVLVCRDCCCGNPHKHPAQDHDAQLDAIRDAMTGIPGGVVAVTRCLEVCERSNVVVIRHQQGRERSETWLGGILDGRQTDALCAWLRDGGPRTAPLPLRLMASRFRRPGGKSRVSGR